MFAQCYILVGTGWSWFSIDDHTPNNFTYVISYKLNAGKFTMKCKNVQHRAAPTDMLVSEHLAEWLVLIRHRELNIVLRNMGLNEDTIKLTACRELE